MEKLIEKLNAASKAYYSGTGEIMSDKEFDTLYDELKKLELKTGIILPNSPTRNVGYEVVSALLKMQHEYPSLSLDKTKDRDDMVRWLGDHQGVLSWKLDGLTVILTYDNGKLVKAATRGDGNMGENIIHNALYFKGVPRRIEDRRHIVIRGEAVIHHDIFNRINESLPGDKQYKNPRSMVSGATRLLDSKKSAKYEITFIPFDLVNARELGFDCVVESMMHISSIGIIPVDWSPVSSRDIVEMIDHREIEVKSLPYSTDGLVVVFDDLSICEKLGATGKHPRYAKAFNGLILLKLLFFEGSIGR